MNAQGGGGSTPTPKPAKKCIGWVEKREKKERKGGKRRQKIGKLRLKIAKRGGKSRKSNKFGLK